MSDLFIYVDTQGQLHRFVPRDAYYYVVDSWAEVFAGTGTKYLDDFFVFVAVKE